MKCVGVIAEDQSDVDVIRELLLKLARDKFSLNRIVGYGCGRIHAKCRAWAEDLRRRGCHLLILVCDLDQQSLRDLSRRLQQALEPCPINPHLIIIPVREIEAWLLADHEAITQALKLRKPVKKQPNPEAIQRPKERLRDIIRERSQGSVVYLNTVHNCQIAKRVTIPQLRRCESFHPLEAFVRATLG